MRIWGKHSVYTHFPQDRNCEIGKRTKITRAPCRRRNGGAVPRAENFGDLKTADHKVLSDNCESRNNHRYGHIRVKPKLHKKPKEACKSSWSPIGIPKSFTLTIPRNLAKLVKIPPGIIARLHHIDLKQMGLLREQVRRVKGGTSAVLLQSGLNESWWADSMECYTYLRNVTDLSSDGKTSYERRLGQPFNLKDRLFHLVHWLSIIPLLRKTSQESINLERKSYLDCSSDTLCTRGEIGRVTY